MSPFINIFSRPHGKKCLINLRGWRSWVQSQPLVQFIFTTGSASCIDLRCWGQPCKYMYTYIRRALATRERIGRLVCVYVLVYCNNGLFCWCKSGKKRSRAHTNFCMHSEKCIRGNKYCAERK